jgi:hypothetical protein
MPSQTFIDNTAHPTAQLYYRQNPFEVIPDKSGGAVPVGDIALIGGMMLSGILAAILKATKPGGDLLIVSHGNDWGLSLPIGTIKHQRSTLDQGSIAVIRDNLAGSETDANAAKQLFLSTADYVTLKDRIQRLQQLKLRRVDLRACNPGASENTMSALLEFFGSDVLCAPDILDSFGKIEVGAPTRNPKTWEKWKKDYPRAGTEGTQLGRFAYQIDISGNTALIHAMADSEERVAEWVKARLGHRSFTKGDPFYHALVRRQPYLFVFANEPGFKEHLVEMKREQLPKRGPVRIDPNAPLPRP